MPDWLDKAWARTEKYATFVAMAALAAVLTVLHLHILENAAVIGTLCDIIALGILGTTLKTRATARAAQRSADRTREEVVKQLEAIRHLLSPKLYSLEECLNDLRARLDKVKAKDEVIIRHFGLDMANAWDRVDKLLTSHPTIKHVEYEIMMMSDEMPHPELLSEQLRRWSTAAKHAMAAITDKKENLGKRLREQERTVNLKIYKYTAMPIVHGLHLVEPKELAVHYIAFCRWDDATYDWGGDKYQAINHVDARLDPLRRDTVDIFEGYYQAAFRDAKPFIEEKIGLIAAPIAVH